MSAIVDFKISQHAVREYANEVRDLERQLKEKDKIIAKLDKKLTELYTEIGEMGAMTDKIESDISAIKDYGPPYGPHNPSGIKGESK